MTQAASGSRRFLALGFPFLAADRWRRQAEAAPEAPLVFIEKVKGALRIVMADSDALALGLAPGMALADARARIPGLLAAQHDPQGDAALLERIADACERYTPMVAIAPPDALVLDITGCAHLFGGEKGLADAALRLMRHMGLRAGHALAGSADAARALARFHGAPAPDEAQAVRRLPVAALSLPQEQGQALHRAGLKRIGDLADMPAAPLAARFGKEAVMALGRLLGREDRPIAPRRPVPMLTVERRFADPVARTDGILGLIGEMVEEAGVRLAEAHQGGRRFEVRLYRSDGATRDLAVETGRPVAGAATVLRLLRDRIETLADPIDPGFGFDMMRLAVPVLEGLAPDQLALEGEGGAGEALAALLDRLGTRHGAARFRRLERGDSHSPERAALERAAAEGKASAAWPAPPAGEPPARPLHLLDPPQPVTAVAELPDGPPLRFRWRDALHEVTRHEGPERIAPGWWDRPAGRPGAIRDYYRVEDKEGGRFWLFRHGMHGEGPAPCWYMHGLFA